MVKKILSIVLWVVTGAAIIVLFAFARKGYLENPLKGIHLNVERSQAIGFVENDSIIAKASAICGMERQASISEIDMMKLRRMLNDNPWIEQSSVYVDLNDTLRITAIEYEPALRVYNLEGRSVYLTREGVIIPSSPRYTPHLIIASGSYGFTTPRSNGNIADSLYLNSGLAEALAIANAISKDQFLQEHIGQIYRNTDNEYEVIVNNLPIQVIVGDTCAVDNKLHRLKVLLEKYQNTTELEGYKTMSLKYKNQIVCTKK